MRSTATVKSYVIPTYAERSMSDAMPDVHHTDGLIVIFLKGLLLEVVPATILKLFDNLEGNPPSNVQLYNIACAVQFLIFRIVTNSPLPRLTDSDLINSQYLVYHRVILLQLDTVHSLHPLSLLSLPDTLQLDDFCII